MNLGDASVAVDSPLTVRPYTEGDHDAWAAFAEASPEATFFHRIEWRSLIQEVFRHPTHYLVAVRGSKLTGILPLAQVRSRLFGHSLVSLPFAVYGGAAAIDDASRAGLHRAAIEVARELGVDHLELRNLQAREPGWPRQELYVRFRKEILGDVDANMAAIPRKQRAMVRKGIARELVSEIDLGVERFFDLYADNMHRHGTPPFSRRYFEALKATFGANCEVLTVLSPQGRPISSVLSFYFRDEVLPYYAGDLTEARDLAANDFKYWELMRRACERGCRSFDYGRSKRDSGSYSFKRNWGFLPEPLHYEYQLLKREGVPQNNPANPKYRAMIAVWQRLPRPLVNALGPMLVRNLG
jgi:FemAB-related protein (PEP-CTERM system-associated)